MDRVRQLIAELEGDPDRFRDTRGYDRLLRVLRAGHVPDALKEALRKNSKLAGDLLWTIAELENVEPFVADARPYLSSEDKGCAAYAMEVVLRGGHGRDDLRDAFEQLRRCDVAVCKHAVRTLAGGGLDRIISVLRDAGYGWSLELAEDLSELSGRVPRKDVESLISAISRDQQVVGLAIATLAREQDAAFADLFAHSQEAWGRELW